MDLSEKYPGFTITDDPVVRRPKGMIRRKKPKADMGFIRGDRIITTEEAIWLNPHWRAENLKEIRSHLR